MDPELRLAALSKLVAVKTDEVERRLLAALNRAEEVLVNSTDYESLSAALKTIGVLASRFHARVMPMLEGFVKSIGARDLTDNGEPIPASWRKYRSASHLIREAIDVPHAVRLVHTDRLLALLLDLSRSGDSEIRNKAERTLEAMAEFDLNLFYGEQGIGAKVQAEIVTYFANFQDRALVENANIILRMLRGALSSSIEGHAWTYDSVTISRGGIVAAGGVAEMRAAAIALLKRMYLLDENVHYRRNVLSALDAAIHRERPGDADTAAMFERDAVDVLAFLRERVATEELPLIEAIEHDAYWDYYHAASPRIADAALAVRDAIEGLDEYQIYKQLIGFEGIQGAWEELKRSETAWNYTNDKRQQAAARYVDEISDDNYALWRDRILTFSRTRSNDMATFPIYYEFLKSIAEKRPQLALELVERHQDVMNPFLIALLRGLWSSERREDAEKIAQRWIAGRTHLADLAKSLNVDERPRLDLLAKVIQEGDQAGDLHAVVEAMGVATRQFLRGHADAKDVFMQGLRAEVMRQDASWASVVWFDRDFPKLVDAMDQTERVEVLANMAWLPKLDYQAEEVLFAVGQHDPQGLLEFLLARLRKEASRSERASETEADDEERFEAVPYGLHRLNKLLAKTPEALLSMVRREFESEASAVSSFRLVGLIKAVFPNLEQPLQDQLLTYVPSGKPADIKFVVEVLRTYDGAAPILPISKEIIKAVPERSSVWSEVAAAIESTGVVMGEYGMATAYEAKRATIAPWMDDGNPRVRAFATWLTENLDQMIVHERQRAAEGLALRKHRYGVGQNDQAAS